MVSFWVGLVILAVLGAIFVLRSRGETLHSALVNARKSGEVAAVVAFIEGSPTSSHATLWDQAIGSLWQAYARDTATRLIAEGVQRSDADILQYWFEKALQVEPEIVSEVLPPEFIAEYFQPKVAARCGRRGCC